ncbi:MAG: dihydroorotate dehydrogenase [Oscillospiraceae bacterium]|jgi:dihydroorotate dehydrogenase (NAD+) catalytic subunit|nr:dihydroorotate dehydrogenase [Oscillospiraceae bacterium]
MPDLKINFCGIEFKNPVFTASGTYGFGREFNALYPISLLGGISCKGTTLAPREGNPPPRIAETPSGILNSVGLQNPGVEHFINEDLPWLLEQKTGIIVNIAGSTVEEYCEMAERLSETAVDIIELNISCPNVKHGGAAFGTSCASVTEITGEVKKHCTKPLMVKLSPNVTSIADIAKSAEAAGADALSLINTIMAMRIDIETRRPILKNNKGGLSGPAVLPVAIRMVNEVANAVNLPIMGMGGISDWRDALEMLLAGASAVQVGTILFNDPLAPIKIIDGLNRYLKSHGIARVSELTGAVQLW